MHQVQVCQSQENMCLELLSPMMPMQTTPRPRILIDALSINESTEVFVKLSSFQIRLYSLVSA
eukprot:2601002-Pleurochrysis_carterae.AAC.4